MVNIYQTSLLNFAFLASLLPNAFALPQSRHAELARRQTVTANPNAALPGWTFIGCFTDNIPEARSLQEHTVLNPGMTPLVCTEFCGNFTAPLAFAGTEFTDECFCDFNIQGTAVQVNDTLCDFPCGGDDTLTCGGASLISVFQNAAAPLPANKAKVGTWAFDGCFTDVVGTNPRTLLGRFDIPAGVTIDTCTATCGAAGFSISGLEFGQECWCGDAFALPAANITAPLSDCSRACEADPAQLCGAASRLSVYIDTAKVSSAVPSATPTVVTSASAKPTVVPPTTAVPPTTIAKPTTVVPTTIAVPPTTIAAPTTIAKPTTSAAPPPPPKPTTTDNPRCVRRWVFEEGDLVGRERIFC